MNHEINVSTFNVLGPLKKNYQCIRFASHIFN